MLTVCVGTLDTGWLQLQEKKRILTSAALSGDKLKNQRLGVEDLIACSVVATMLTMRTRVFAWPRVYTIILKHIWASCTIVYHAVLFSLALFLPYAMFV